MTSALGHVSSFYHHIHFNETLQVDRRSSSAWSYLYPQTQQREGLTVITGHLVNSVLTSTTGDGGNITATGVSVIPTAGGSNIDVQRFKGGSDYCWYPLCNFIFLSRINIDLITRIIPSLPLFFSAVESEMHRTFFFFLHLHLRLEHT